MYPKFTEVVTEPNENKLSERGLPNVSINKEKNIEELKDVLGLAID
jgi:hypothetical protein